MSAPEPARRDAAVDPRATADRLNSAMLLHTHRLLVTLCCLCAPAAADTLAAFNISLDGAPRRFYAVSQAWQSRFFNASSDGASVALTAGGRFYVATERMPTPGGLVASSYWQAPLLGRELSYTVDLSGVGCSCNAALVCRSGGSNIR